MVYVMSIERIGIQKGEAAALSRLIELKFGAEAIEAYRDHIEDADAETLLIWLERILTAEQVNEIFDPQ